MLDKETVRHFQEWAASRFADIDKFDGEPLTLKRGSGARYDPTTGEIKLSLTFIVGDEGKGRAAQWDEFCHMHGLAPSDLGREFKSGPEKYQIVGLNLTRRMRPIIAKRIAGRVRKGDFAFPAIYVLKRLRPWNVSTGPGPEGIYWYEPEEDGRRQREYEAAAAAS